MAVIGHEAVRQELAKNDFQTVLLLGPESVGKRVIGRELVSSGPRGHAYLEIQDLTAAGAREVQQFIATGRAPKWVLIDLDSATEATQNILLKTLEEPPANVRFILVGSRPPLPTIVSRCVVFRVGVLPTAQVEEVMVQQGMDPAVARKQAPLGGGRVRPAMEGVSSQSRSRVSAVLRACAETDAGKLDTALAEWDAEDHELLGRWAAEAAVGRWRVFDRAFAPGVDQRFARALLGALAGHSLASPRLAAQAALVPFCSRR
jgi:hypothetical protein